MNPESNILENTVVEELLAEFNEALRCEGKPRFELLQLCPEDQRKELLGLMNVAALAYRALAPARLAHLVSHEELVAVAV